MNICSQVHQWVTATVTIHQCHLVRPVSCALPSVDGALSKRKSRVIKRANFMSCRREQHAIKRDMLSVERVSLELEEKAVSY